jgi:dihydrofolate reductase
MTAERKANSFLIAARAKNGAIGYHGAIPWDAPHDLKQFSQLTRGAILIMGRATFESLPRVLPGRVSIMLGSKPPSKDGVKWAKSFGEALHYALGVEAQTNAIAFIGGESIYRRALGLEWLTRAYITDVDVETPGDRFIPQLGQEWTVHDSYHLAPGRVPRCQFTEYRRPQLANKEI